MSHNAFWEKVPDASCDDVITRLDHDNNQLDSLELFVVDWPRRWVRPSSVAEATVESSSSSSLVLPATLPSSVLEDMTSRWSLTLSSVSENEIHGSEIRKSICGGQCWCCGGLPQINECVGNTVLKISGFMEIQNSLRTNFSLNLYRFSSMTRRLISRI